MTFQNSVIWSDSQQRVATKLCFWLGILVTILCFSILEYHTIGKGNPNWWLWWDQGQYLEAAKAFFHNDWNETHHWYPPGYSLLAVPFVTLFPKDPFVVIDLFCLLGSFCAVVRLATLMKLPIIIGIVTFLLTTTINNVVLRHYVLPWTSTPTGCLILLALCLCLTPPKPRNSFLLGAMAGAILLIKPIDNIALLPAGLYYLGEIMRPKTAALSRKFLWLNISAGLLSLTFFGASAFVLHWEIYGAHLSGYEAMTTDGPVFLADQLGTKLYSIFIDPKILYGSFNETKALFISFPWLLPGLCGMIYGSGKKLSLAALSTSTLIYVGLYSSYYDLTPQNLWHYNVVHYFVWTLPVFGLFGFYLLKEIIITRSYVATGITASALVLLLACHPYLFPLSEEDTHLSGRTITVDLTNCSAPCTVDINEPGIIFDEKSAGQITLDPQSLQIIGTRSWRVFPYEQGVRLLLLNTTGLGSPELIFPESMHFENTQNVRISTMHWKYFF